MQVGTTINLCDQRPADSRAAFIIIIIFLPSVPTIPRGV